MDIRNKLDVIYKNKVLVFLLSTLSILLIIIIIILFTLTSSDKNTTLTPSSSPSPIQSITTSILNDESNVSLYNPLSISFTPPVSEKEKTEIKITGNPSVLLDRSWDQENTTLTLTPLTALKPSQKYSLSISSSRGTILRVFTTTANEAENNISKSKLSEKEVQELYPWYKKLPLFTGKYHVSFDINTEKFTAIIYAKDKAQEDQMKEIILANLKTLGVDTNKYIINWQIN